jgi:hypothetical protein
METLIFVLFIGFKLLLTTCAPPGLERSRTLHPWSGLPPGPAGGKIEYPRCTVFHPNRAAFEATYRAALRECVERGEYAWPAANCDTVAGRMIEAVYRGSANLDGPAFTLTFKRLGLKRTRKALTAFLNL